MPPLTAPTDELTALARGRAWVDLSRHRRVQVTGADARRWLHDLVTTDVASLGAGDSRRTLLLDPTGHIRADLHVAFDGSGFWLLQAPEQPEHVATALDPYVLSSDVRLEDRSSQTSLIALPGGSPNGGERGLHPSVLGGGNDLLTPVDEAIRPPDGRRVVGSAAVEVWRIRRGIARMGPDFDRRSIPAEAGLSGTIDTTKGCFLGQESIARVSNLGHPAHLLLHLAADEPVDAGSAVVDARDDDVGVVTSAASDHEGTGTWLLARIRWDARDGLLRSEGGAELLPVGRSD
ncbi:MAG: YgfZ/GcvT domain-containing protein [Actinomycetota bacterium]